MISERENAGAMKPDSESTTRQVQAVLYCCATNGCRETFWSLADVNIHTKDTSHWDLVLREMKNCIVGDVRHLEWLQGDHPMEYRSKGEQDIWHFCRKCSKWPRSNFDALSFQNLSDNFELCKECVALNHQGKCEALPPGYF